LFGDAPGWEFVQYLFCHVVAPGEQCKCGDLAVVPSTMIVLGLSFDFSFWAFEEPGQIFVKSFSQRFLIGLPPACRSS
jgi:hypothetical protein